MRKVTWPQAFAFRAEDKDTSKAEHGGDKYRRYPAEFKTTTGGEARIDFVYCTPPLYKSIVAADVVTIVIIYNQKGLPSDPFISIR